jgi:cytidylate kinase
MSFARIYVIGGSGSGKSTLARQIGERTGLPVHDLDRVARIDGVAGSDRSIDERTELVRGILNSGSWIVEGIHLGWTRPLMEAADTIIWLDHVTWGTSSRRIVRRFVGGALAEARRQRGLRRFLRLRDYRDRLRELAAAIPESRRYHSAGDDAASEASRAATADVLRPYEWKVVRCRTEAEVASALEASTGNGRPTGD